MEALNNALYAVTWVLRLWGRRALRLLGWQGIVLLMSGALAIVSLTVHRHTLSKWRTAGANALLSTAAQGPKAQASLSGEQATQQALAAFYAALPGELDAPQVLTDLFDMASAQQLTLAKGEYKLTRDDAGRFFRLQMIFPVRGEPGAVQRFLNAALSSQRSLSFESVQFKRDRADSANVEARIQWALLLKPREAILPVSAIARSGEQP